MKARAKREHRSARRPANALVRSGRAELLEELVLRVAEERVPERVLGLPLELRGRLVLRETVDSVAEVGELAVDVAVAAGLVRAAGSVGLRKGASRQSREENKIACV